MRKAARPLPTTKLPGRAKSLWVRLRSSPGRNIQRRPISIRVAKMYQMCCSFRPLEVLACPLASPKANTQIATGNGGRSRAILCSSQVFRLDQVVTSLPFNPGNVCWAPNKACFTFDKPTPVLSSKRHITYSLRTASAVFGLAAIFSRVMFRDVLQKSFKSFNPSKRRWRYGPENLLKRKATAAPLSTPWREASWWCAIMMFQEALSYIQWTWMYSGRPVATFTRATFSLKFWSGKGSKKSPVILVPHKLLKYVPGCYRLGF